MKIRCGFISNSSSSSFVIVKKTNKMSTRSNIILYKDNKYYTIFCRWDGYPGWVGKLLLNYYQSPQKIWELIQLGNILSLGREIGKKHKPEVNNSSEVVTAHHRDKGEKWENTHYRIYNTKKEALVECINDFTYIFEKESPFLTQEDESLGKWYFRCCEDDFKELLMKDCDL